MPQQPALYGKLSVAENLRLFARLERVADVEGTVERMLARRASTTAPDEQVARLSGGNRQRVNIAIGLLAVAAACCCSTSRALRSTRASASVCGSSSARSPSAARPSSTRPMPSRRPSATPTRVLVLADGERLFWGTPAELEQTVIRNGGGEDEESGGHADFEAAFVSFLRQRGH